MTRFVAFVMAAVVSLSGICMAEVGQPQKVDEWEMGGSFSLMFNSKYCAARISRTLHDEPVLWSELYLDLPKGFFVDVWWSLGLDDAKIASNFGDEIDITLGWKGKIGDPKRGDDFDIKLYVSYFEVTPWNTMFQGLDVLDYHFSISKEYQLGEWNGKHFIRPEFRIEWLSRAEYFQHGAAIVMPSITHTWKEMFGLKELTFVHQMRLVYDGGFGGNDTSGVFLQSDGGFKWRIAKNVDLVFPAWRAITPIASPHDGRGAELSINGGIIISF